jgi:hypothetical protein
MPKVRKRLWRPALTQHRCRANCELSVREELCLTGFPVHSRGLTSHLLDTSCNTQSPKSSFPPLLCGLHLAFIAIRINHTSSSRHPLSFTSASPNPRLQLPYLLLGEQNLGTLTASSPPPPTLGISTCLLLSQINWEPTCSFLSVHYIND